MTDNVTAVGIATGATSPDRESLLFRQIHPQFVQNGQLASSAFTPNSSDGGMLSVDLSWLTNAAKAFHLYVGSGRQSCGTYAVTVDDLLTHALSYQHDPIAGVADKQDNPAHALVDYTALNSNQQKKVGKRLAILASARGRLHP